MMQCRMCSQRLTRPGRLCRDCESELARARLAAESVQDLSALPEFDAARVADASAFAAFRVGGVRLHIAFAAFCLGIAAAAAVYTLHRSTASAPESVMLDRDVRNVRPRLFAPSRTAVSDERGAPNAAAVRTPTPTVAVREAPRRQIVAVTSPVSMPPAPQLDRVLGLSDALAQCAAETFFSRLACEQRARSRYCDGIAGQVPQCPEERPRDYGQ